MDIAEIKRYLARPIDKHALETELEQHAFMFQEATGRIPEVRFDMDLMKQNLETTQYRLDIQIRAEFERTGKKVTESTIVAEIKTQQQYLEASEAFLATKKEYDELNQLKDAFMAREASIKGLIQLYSAQYWSLSGTDSVKPAAAENASGKFKTRKEA